LSKYAEKKKEMLKGEEVYGKHTHSNNFCWSLHTSHVRPRVRYHSFSYT